MNAECPVGSALATRRAAKPLTARQARVVRELLAEGVTAKQITREARAVTLSKRENDLLRLLIHGADDSNKGIAYALGITPGTVKVYFFHLSAKISGARGMSRVALALWAERRWHDQSEGDQ